MPSASTSAADSPPARPSASSAAPWAACLATVAKPVEHMHGGAGDYAGEPSRQLVAHAGTRASRPDRITSRACGTETASAATALTALST